jgi:hypothetical protein
VQQLGNSCWKVLKDVHCTQVLHSIATQLLLELPHECVLRTPTVTAASDALPAVVLRGAPASALRPAP